jgi:rubrerythrin
MSLKGTKTEANLRQAFAVESEANRRYLYFAQQADIEGHPAAAVLFKNIAESETGHAHGHLEYLATMGSGDPTTGMAIGSTEDNYKSAIAGETYEYSEMYPGFAQQAREEGFGEIADWFDNLARAEKSHAVRFQQALDSL